jgi:DNA-binding GntR family transcriptional regulator
MANVQTQPTLVEQVVNAIVSEIVDGDLPANSRLIQDELARAYGVSRQPVQQALLLLRDRGMVREAPGRGLIVSPLDVDLVRNLYEVRAMLDGLAARLQPNAVRSGRRAKDRFISTRVAPQLKAARSTIRSKPTCAFTDSLMSYPAIR